jgi:2-haloalkanoic acid dehalogenase type II
VAKPGVRVVVFDWYETLVQITSDMRCPCSTGLLATRDSISLLERLVSGGVKPLAGSASTRSTGRCLRFAASALAGESEGKRCSRSMGVHGGGELVARHYAGLHASALPYREAAVAVERLASRHRLGVLSDADTDFLRLSLDRAGFAFAAVACSEQLQNYKPHIETFRAVCQRLDTRPDETVFVSDQPRNDIAGARNAGMRTVWINRNRLAWPDHPHDPAARNCQPPDVEIASLVDLQAVLS